MIKLSIHRRYAKIWNRARHSELFESQPQRDRRGFRIYLPLATSSRPPKVPVAIKKEIDSKGYKVECYLQGLASSKTDPRRKIKIGKLLSENTKLKNIFDNDPTRNSSKIKKKIIAISRHPVDLVKMSTDRGWTSCMDLKDGCNRSYIRRDVQYGTLIAYQTTADDLSIKNPSGRILIKPYINTRDKNQTFLVCEGEAYGTVSPEFKKTIVAWVNEANKNACGVFKFKPSMYDDALKESVIYRIPEVIDTKEKVAMILNQFYCITRNYTINDDLSVDVKGSVNLYDGLCSSGIDAELNEFATIMVKFGKVTGDFNCSSMRLTSLKNAPHTVMKSFYCADNMLKSLKHFPRYVGKDIDIGDNLLSRFTGLPKDIHGKIVDRGNFGACNHPNRVNYVGSFPWW